MTTLSRIAFMKPTEVSEVEPRRMRAASLPERFDVAPPRPVASGAIQPFADGRQNSRLDAALSDPFAVTWSPRFVTPLRPDSRPHSVLQHRDALLVQAPVWQLFGLDGRPRALHVTESLACIDFTDTAPTLNPAGTTPLADCALFRVDHHHLAPGAPVDPQGFRLVGIVTGSLEIDAESHGPGTFCLIPASRAAGNRLVAGSNGASFLEISLP